LADGTLGKSMNTAFYTYGHYTEAGRLFYIGKGQGKRAHVKTGRSRHWKNIVNKHGLKVEIFANWQSEQDAHTHERFLIACFRDDLGTQLVNLTDGGEGSSGWSPDADTRARMQNASKQVWMRDGYREKIVKAQRIAQKNPACFTEKKLASILNNAEIARIKLQDPIVKAEAAKKNSEKSLAMWSDPEFRARMKQQSKELWTAEKRAEKGVQIQGRIRMTNGVLEKNVKPDDVESMMAQGYVRGRKPRVVSKRATA
jgi:hypothetical protein